MIKGYIARLIKEGRLHLIKGKLNVERSDTELDLKLKQGQLVEVDQVGDHLDKIFSAVRQRLLATPSKMPLWFMRKNRLVVLVLY